MCRKTAGFWRIFAQHRGAFGLFPLAGEASRSPFAGHTEGAACGLFFQAAV
jgi:hypothetical protein